MRIKNMVYAFVITFLLAIVGFCTVDAIRSYIL